MSKKQTAVEWLVEQYVDSAGILSPIDIQNALQMEREQRFKDFQEGFQAATDAIIGTNKSVQSMTYGKEVSHE